jgi:CTP synthase
VLASLVAALVAALCYGVASVMQAIAVRGASTRSRAQASAGGVDPGLLPRMLSQWRFIVSVVIDLLGFIAQLVALRRLPLFAVQAMVAANLAVVAVLATVLIGATLSLREWLAVIGVVAGVGLLGSSAGAEGASHAGVAFKIALIGATAVVGLCGLVAARMLRDPARTLALGTVAGFGFGAVGIAARVLNGFAPLTLLRDPAAYAVVAAGIVSFVFYATALEGGSVTVATSAVVLAETLPPAVVGVLFLGDTTRHGLTPVAVIGFALAVASAVMLARFGEADHAPGHAGGHHEAGQIPRQGLARLYPVPCYSGGPWTCGFTPQHRRPREPILAAAASQSRLASQRLIHTKHIFVTGGVASSLGKGLTASSLGRLLKMRGLRVKMQKLDPYLNVDPGTMNPFQHGEVFVTDDGTETDLDVGHYERFLDIRLTGEANVTTGQVYSSVIAKERRGEYLGDTVQVIPHITNEIKSRILGMAGPDVDLVITEVGGTVGDIESQPFLESIRQIRHEIGRDRCFFIHVSLLPYIGPSGELKTKPTQHSVAALRSIGIQPDAIVARSDRPISDGLKRKISLMCDVDEEAVVSTPDAPSIYDIPKVLHGEGLDAYIVRKLQLPFHDVDWSAWDDLLRRVHRPARSITIALVGKYVDLPDAYLSPAEALKAGGFGNDAKVTIRWVTSDDCENPDDAAGQLEGVDGILIPGGFGVRGIEGKIGAIRYAREHQVPVLGLCLGLQCMVIEVARDLAGIESADSAEFDPATPDPVVATMADQEDVVAGDRDMGGTMRLGLYPANLVPGTIVSGLYGDAAQVEERHRHRYEVNNAYRERLEQAGLVFSGLSPDGRLVEFIELPRDTHPFFVATQAHPEFLSRPTRPHPLFGGLIAAALARSRAGEAGSRAAATA